MRCALSLIAISLLLSSGSAFGDSHSGETSNLYRLDVEKSDIRLLTYRAGVLSKLGHNHVISTDQLSGTIRMHSDFEQSEFELEIAVQELVVDDALRRGEEGEDFASEPSERDIDGTRRNMLGKRVLNAEKYPTIKVTGTGPKSNEEGATLDISIELLGRVVELSVPTTVTLEGDVLEATGAFPLSHSELGLRPFSAMLGSLRVAKQMELKYRIRANQIPMNN